MLQLNQWHWWPGFLAVIIPVIIHLWRRDYPDIIAFPILKFIERSESVKINSLKLHELLLMILRILLFAFFAWILLEPLWKVETNANNQNKKWILAHQGTTELAEVQSQIDRLVENGFTLHFLNSGFLSLLEGSEPLNIHSSSSYSSWEAIRSINHLLNPADTIIIFSDPRYEKSTGSRPMVSAHVIYHQVPVGPADSDLTDNFRLAKLDWDLTGKFTAGNWTFSKRAGQEIRDLPQTGDSTMIQISIIKGSLPEKYDVWFTTALEIIREQLTDRVTWSRLSNSDTSLIEDSDVVIWLDDRSGYARKEEQTLISLDLELQGDKIINSTADPQEWIFCPIRYSEKQNHPDLLPIRLFEIIFSEPDIDSSLAEITGLHTNPEFVRPEYVMPPNESIRSQSPRSFDFWFFLTILIIIAIEFHQSGYKLKQRRHGG